MGNKRRKGLGRLKHRCIECKFYIQSFTTVGGSNLARCLKFNKKPSSPKMYFNCKDFKK